LNIKPAIFVSSVQAVVACYVTALRVCTLVLVIVSLCMFIFYNSTVTKEVVKFILQNGFQFWISVILLFSLTRIEAGTKILFVYDHTRK